MRKLKVWVELPEDKFRAYLAESRRRGVSVESLVERNVQLMLRDAQQEESEGTDHPVFPE